MGVSVMSGTGAAICTAVVVGRFSGICGVRIQNSMRLVECADSLRLFIPSSMWFLAGSDKGTATNFAQISEKVRREPWQWLDKRSRKKSWSVYETYELTGTGKHGETSEEQSQEHAHHFPISWGLFTKNLSSQFKQSVHILLDVLWRQWKCVKTSSRNLTTK
jgi:hypothetical protein